MELPSVDLNGKDSRMNGLIFQCRASLGSEHHMTSLAELLTLTSVSTLQHKPGFKFFLYMLEFRGYRWS